MEEHSFGMGPIEELEIIFKRQLENGVPSTLKAIHIGTKEELETLKTEKEKIDDLTSRLEALEAKAPLYSDIIHLPDANEIKELLKRTMREGKADV